MRAVRMERLSCNLPQSSPLHQRYHHQKPPYPAMDRGHNEEDPFSDLLLLTSNLVGSLPEP
jgi:hypothetical protein